MQVHIDHDVHLNHVLQLLERIDTERSFGTYMAAEPAALAACSRTNPSLVSCI